MMAKCRAFLWC